MSDPGKDTVQNPLAPGVIWPSCCEPSLKICKKTPLLGSKYGLPTGMRSLPLPGTSRAVSSTASSAKSSVFTDTSSDEMLSASCAASGSDSTSSSVTPYIAKMAAGVAFEALDGEVALPGLEFLLPRLPVDWLALLWCFRSEGEPVIELSRSRCTNRHIAGDSFLPDVADCPFSRINLTHKLIELATSLAIFRDTEYAKTNAC